MQPIDGSLQHNGVSAVAFSPASKSLASVGKDKLVRLWNLAIQPPSGESLMGHENFVETVAFSPDGKIVASGDMDGVVRLWNISTRQPDGDPLRHKRGPVHSIAFSPDGTTLAVGGQEWPQGAEREDGSIRIWDISTRKLKGEPLLGDKGTVNSVAFSADGKTLVSGAGFGIIRLWDVPSYRELGALQAYKNYVSNIAVSRHGKTLASAGDDGAIILWDIDASSWQRRACSVANRNLSCDEWREYLGSEPYQKTCPALPGPEKCN